MSLALPILRRRRFTGPGISLYAIGAYDPQVVADFAGIYSANEYYRTGGSTSTFSNMFTHARASNATMVDSDGLLKWAPHNLIQQSNTFNTTWAATANTVAPGQSDPDGGSSAYRLTSTTNSLSFIQQINTVTSVSGAQYTYRLKAKKISTDDWIAVYVAGVGTNSVHFDLANGVTGAEQADVVSSSIEPLGNGWYLCTTVFTATAGGVLVGDPTIHLCGQDTTFNSTVGAAADVYQFHLYRSDLGGMVNNPDRNDSYVPTTSSIVYLPRRNHYGWNGSTWVNKGLLLETEARTNLFDYSNDLSQWTNGGSDDEQNVVGVTDPAGDEESNRLFDTALNEKHEIYNSISATSGVNYTFSVYLKSAELGHGILHIRDAGAGRYAVAINLTTGVITSTTTVGTPTGTRYTSEPLSNGWHRVSISIDAAASALMIAIIMLSDTATPSWDANANYAYTGDGTSGIYIYGAQLEAGSTPSSYIPTTGAATDRLAETLTIPAAKMAWDASNVSLQMQGEMTYADTNADAGTGGNAGEVVYYTWRIGISDYVGTVLHTGATYFGLVIGQQEVAGARDTAIPLAEYSPDVNVPYNIASRHTSSAINTAKDGTAATANTTPTALPDLSTIDFSLGYDYMGTIALFRQDNNDWADSGIVTATSKPVNILVPTISGSPSIGSVLTTTDGTWADSPTFTYQWLRDGAVIVGATANTYTLVSADLGAIISCRVTATLNTLTTEATSNTLGPVVAVPAGAIRDRADDPILDRAGAYIEVRA